LLLKLSLKLSLEFSLANAQVLAATRAAIAMGRKMFFMVVCCVKYLVFC
jgi:hypothetical protein